MCVAHFPLRHKNPEGTERFRGLKNLCKKPTNLSTFFATVTNLQGMSFLCFFVKQCSTFQEEKILPIWKHWEILTFKKWYMYIYNCGIWLSYPPLLNVSSLLFAVNDLRRLIEKAGGKLDHSLYAQSATHVASLSLEVSKNIPLTQLNNCM